MLGGVQAASDGLDEGVCAPENFNQMWFEGGNVRILCCLGDGMRYSIACDLPGDADTQRAVVSWPLFMQGLDYLEGSNFFSEAAWDVCHEVADMGHESPDKVVFGDGSWGTLTTGVLRQFSHNYNGVLWSGITESYFLSLLKHSPDYRLFLMIKDRVVLHGLLHNRPLAFRSW